MTLNTTRRSKQIRNKLKRSRSRVNQSGRSGRSGRSNYDGAPGGKSRLMCDLEGCTSTHVYSNLANMRHHQRKVHRGQRCCLNGCDYAFVNSTEFKQHKLVAHGIGIFKCNFAGLCPYVSTTLTDLTQHKKDEHSGTLPPVSLSSVSLSPLTYDETPTEIYMDIDIPEMSEREEMDLVTSLVGSFPFNFHETETLDKDEADEILELLNSSEGAPGPGGKMKKKYICNGCEYSADTKTHLTRHMRKHTGERPFACNFVGCEYRARQESNLIKHIRTHTGERPFACNFVGCDYRAVSSSSLNGHKRTHTGERPHPCDFVGCTYRASNTTHLKNHKRTIHKIGKSNTVESNLEDIAPVSKEETKYMEEPISEMNDTVLEYVESLVGSHTFDFKES